MRAALDGLAANFDLRQGWIEAVLRTEARIITARLRHIGTVPDDQTN